jgi:aspartate oxidase
VSELKTLENKINSQDNSIITAEQKFVELKNIEQNLLELLTKITTNKSDIKKLKEENINYDTDLINLKKNNTNDNMIIRDGNFINQIIKNIEDKSQQIKSKINIIQMNLKNVNKNVNKICSANSFGRGEHDYGGGARRTKKHRNNKKHRNSNKKRRKTKRRY